MFKNNSQADLLQLSKNAVREALVQLIDIDEANLKDYFFSNKVPNEIKADADLIIESILIDRLSKSGLSIISEESGLIKAKRESNLKFIIDPIDGTVNFVRNLCSCSISVALFDGDIPIFGVLGSYPSGILSWGGKNLGAYMEDIPIRVSSITDTQKAVLCTGFPSRFNFGLNTMMGQVSLMEKFAKIRMLGSASQSLLQVAQGSADAYAEDNIMIWDVAAGIAIVEGSGGEFKIDIKKDYNSPIKVEASNGLIDGNLWKL